MNEKRLGNYFNVCSLESDLIDDSFFFKFNTTYRCFDNDQPIIVNAALLMLKYMFSKNILKMV